MKLTLDRRQFTQAWQTVASVVPAHAPKEVLKSVLLEAEDGDVFVAATDMEVTIRAEVEGVEVEGAGKLLLPVSQTTAILRESTDETLVLTAEPQAITIVGARSRFRLPNREVDSFPLIAPPTEAATEIATVQAAAFAELVRRTMFATDQASSRYALGGVLLETQTERLLAVATDGRRLAKAEIAATVQHRFPEQCIVPVRALQTIDRALSDAGTLEVLLERELIVKSEKIMLRSRLVEGHFPKWRDVLPQRESPKINVLLGPFFAAVRQAGITLSKEESGVLFTFDTGLLSVSSSTSESGSAHIDIPLSYDGDKVEVLLAYKFVLEFLRVLKNETGIVVDVLDAASAAVFSVGDSYQCVIMPLSQE